jgi:hypothetical protein
MTRQKKTYYLILPILILALAALACGTGYRTTSKISGNNGEVQISMQEANGTDTTSVEINEDWIRASISTRLVLNMDSGSCRVYLTGENNTAISLETSAGSPVETYGELITDGFGEVSMQTDCQNAQNLVVSIYFTKQ